MNCIAGPTARDIRVCRISSKAKVRADEEEDKPRERFPKINAVASGEHPDESRDRRIILQPTEQPIQRESTVNIRRRDVSGYKQTEQPIHGNQYPTVNRRRRRVS